jgi:hypothetical protein
MSGILSKINLIGTNLMKTIQGMVLFGVFLTASALQAQENTGNEANYPQATEAEALGLMPGVKTAEEIAPPAPIANQQAMGTQFPPQQARAQNQAQYPGVGQNNAVQFPNPAYIQQPQQPVYGYAPYGYPSAPQQGYYNPYAYSSPYAARPPVQQQPKKKVTHPWGDTRYIWPDFYTDTTGDMFDKMINAPYDMGRMPGGWKFPSLSMPDPVTVSDAIANQVPPFAEEAGNMVPLDDVGNLRPF